MRFWSIKLMFKVAFYSQVPNLPTKRPFELQKCWLDNLRFGGATKILGDQTGQCRPCQCSQWAFANMQKCNFTIYKNLLFLQGTLKPKRKAIFGFRGSRLIGKWQYLKIRFLGLVWSEITRECSLLGIDIIFVHNFETNKPKKFSFYISVVFGLMAPLVWWGWICYYLSKCLCLYTTLYELWIFDMIKPCKSYRPKN